MSYSNTDKNRHDYVHQPCSVCAGINLSAGQDIFKWIHEVRK